MPVGTCVSHLPGIPDGISTFPACVPDGCWGFNGPVPQPLWMRTVTLRLLVTIVGDVFCLVKRPAPGQSPRSTQPIGIRQGQHPAPNGADIQGGKQMHRYGRVVVKMSGGAFAGAKDWGFDRDVIDGLAREIITLANAGIQVAVMVGGGNIFRGHIADQWGIDGVEADHIGMTATVLNSLMLRGALKAQDHGLEVRVMSAVPMAAFAEPFIRLRAIKHLEKGYVVVIAAGTGQPLVTTDYPAVQRAIEIRADAILAAKQGTEGVRSADPNIDRDARLYRALSYDDVVAKQLLVMDQSAFSPETTASPFTCSTPTCATR